MHDSLLHCLADENLAADAPTWTDFVTHLLRGTPEPSWEIQHYLPQMVKALRRAASRPLRANRRSDATRVHRRTRLVSGGRAAPAVATR